MKHLQVYGLFTDGIPYYEAMGLSKCFDTYAIIGEEISEIGFNQNSGYTYIALENGIIICSMMGGECEYLVTDFDKGEETFFDSYKEAYNLIKELYDYL